MAGVGGDRVGERGQLLLAGAFVLAVTLIGLTVVFTASDYTASLSSERPAAEQGSDAVAVREAVRADLAEALGVVHDRYDPDPPPNARDPLKDAFEDVLAQVSAGVRDHYARRGRVVSLDPSPDYLDGYRVSQSSGDTFGKPDERTTGSPVGDWDVVNTLLVRNVTFVFSDVPGTSDPPFRLVFDSWHVEVFEDGSDWTVLVEDTASGYRATCTRSGAGSEMTVDVSGATVEGDHCAALAALDPGITYTGVRIENGNEAKGRFWVTTVDDPFGSVTCSTPHTTCERAIYRARVDLRYRSGSVEYEAPIRVAPGEIR